MAYKTRPWTSEQSREVLIAAAWESLRLRAPSGDHELDVPDVLDRAAGIWLRRFPDMPEREFTRGSITSSWSSVGDFEREVILGQLSSESARARSTVDQFGRSVEECLGIRESAARRRHAIKAIRNYIEEEVSRLMDRALSTLYHRGLLDHELASVQQRIASSERIRLERLLKIYTVAVPAAGWTDVSPAHLMHMHAALIEGTAWRWTIYHDTPFSMYKDAGLAAIAIGVGLAESTPKQVARPRRKRDTSLQPGHKRKQRSSSGQIHRRG